MTKDSEKHQELARAVEAIEKQYGPIVRALEKYELHDKVIIDELTRLAEIPAGSAGLFGTRIFGLLRGAQQNAKFRISANERKHAAPVKRAEDGIRAAYDAVRTFTPSQRKVFEVAFLVAGGCRELLNEDVPDGTLGISVLEALVEAFACMTGKSPTFNPRDGAARPKGTPQNWPFRELVGTLWQITNECGGGLSFSCKSNKGYGTMVDALKLLQPLLPGLIPKELDSRAKTIGRIRAELSTKKYQGFNFMQSRFTSGF